MPVIAFLGETRVDLISYFLDCLHEQKRFLHIWILGAKDPRVYEDVIIHPRPCIFSPFIDLEYIGEDVIISVAT